MLVAIYIKLGGLSDEETEARFSHTALRNRRTGSLEFVLSTSTRLHDATTRRRIPSRMSLWKNRECAAAEVDAPYSIGCRQMNRDLLEGPHVRSHFGNVAENERVIERDRQLAAGRSMRSTV
jgi:hypothetical protein